MANVTSYKRVIDGSHIEVVTLYGTSKGIYNIIDYYPNYGSINDNA